MQLQSSKNTQLQLPKIKAHRAHPSMRRFRTLEPPSLSDSDVSSQATHGPYMMKQKQHTAYLYIFNVWLMPICPLPADINIYTYISRERERDREYLDPNSSFGRRANSVQQKSKPKKIFSKRPRHEPKFFGTSPNPINCWVQAKRTSALVAQMEAYFYFEKKKHPHF